MKISKIENKLFEKTIVPGIFIREYLPGLPSNAVKLYLYILYASEHHIDCDLNCQNYQFAVYQFHFQSDLLA